jgi:hypothetical protein
MKVIQLIDYKTTRVDEVQALRLTTSTKRSPASALSIRRSSTSISSATK